MKKKIANFFMALLRPGFLETMKTESANQPMIQETMATVSCSMIPR